MKRSLVTWGLTPCLMMVIANLTGCSGKGPVSPVALVDSYPSIFPDYNGTEVPPNIAPLNFVIQERGYEFHVVLKGAAGESLIVRSSNPVIQFPAEKWHALVSRSAGASFAMEISVRREQGWVSFKPLRNAVAREPIDPYLVYRLINPGYEGWSEIRVIASSHIGLGHEDLQNEVLIPCRAHSAKPDAEPAVFD